MLVDSHCHLDLPELAGELDAVLASMRENGVTHALCVSVTLQDFPRVRALAERYPQFYASVGLCTPDYPDEPEVTTESSLIWARHPRIVAIGETGLDYYRIKGDCEWQRERFSQPHPGGARLREAVDLAAEARAPDSAHPFRSTCVPREPARTSFKRTERS